MITAALLAGGLGKRLQSVISDRPKVLAPVAGRPFLGYLLAQLVQAGAGKAVICTGHLAEQVRATFGGSFGPMPLIYSQEQQPLGTAGALRQALPLLDSDPGLVLNGDSYCDVDISAFRAWQQRRGAAAAIALAQVPDVARFGSIAYGPDQRIASFGEKSGSGAGWINAGVYLILRELLSTIPEGVTCSLEHDCFPKWVSTGLYGYPRGKRFLDIGTASSYAEAETFFAAMPSRTAHAVTR